MSLKSLGIEDLGKLLQEGRPDALLEIVCRYREKLYRIARRITFCHEDAEDVVQETFLKAFEKIEQWQGENFVQWLEQIARNRSIDCLRRKRPCHREIEEHFSPCDDLLATERREIVERIVADLPRGQREILDLKHFQGYTIREIAQMRRCAEGTVKATLFQTFQRLKKDFQAADLME